MMVNTFIKNIFDTTQLGSIHLLGKSYVTNNVTEERGINRLEKFNVKLTKLNLGNPGK